MSAPIRGFRVSGKKFDPSVSLELFPKDTARLAIMFGKNGEGKSTISDGIRAFGPTQNCQLDDVAEVNLLDANGNERLIFDEYGSSVHVFNESFVDDKVRIKDSGLEAIVMLGDTGDIENTIATLKQKIKALNDELETLNDEKEDYADTSNPKSPEYHRSTVRRLLTMGWADRQKAIKNGRQKASVPDKIIDEFLAAEKPEETKEELETYIETAIQKLKEYSSNENLLAPIPSITSSLQINESHIIDLLAQKIETPNPTPRDKLLLEALTRYGDSFIDQARRDFSNPQTDTCPYCLRKIDTHEKTSLLETIERVFNSVVDDHKAELKNTNIQELTLSLDAYLVLGEDAVENVQGALSAWNKVVSEANSLIQKKLSNVYAPIVIQSLGFDQAKSLLVHSIESLEAFRVEWNEGIRNKEQILLDAQEANKKLTWYEIESNSKAYRQQQANEVELISKIEKLNSDVFRLSDQLNKAELSKQNAAVALDTINRDLAFIFFDTSRLVLKGNSGEYRLLVHDKPVRPDSISSGERNAIGLCYFFSLIATGKEKGKEFDQPLLLVLDDPISSFDYENEIAILSYFVEKIKCALEKNPSTRIVVMTHNRQVMNRLSRLRKEFERAAVGNGKSVNYFNLQDGKVLQWEDTDLDYRRSVNWLYSYACNPNDENRNYAGNIARKTIEAYSTFQYSMGFRNVMQSEEILQPIQPESIRVYFRRILTRVVLNSESHTEDIVKAEGDIAANPQYSDETVDQAVRDVLCFIFKIDERHLLSHLEDQAAKENLDAWCRDIESLC